jgi:hypothetical protein
MMALSYYTFNVTVRTPEQMAMLLQFFDPFNKVGSRPCWQRYCVHCGEPIGQVGDGWRHHAGDGPDAYTYCGDEYGTEAAPVPTGR